MFLLNHECSRWCKAVGHGVCLCRLWEEEGDYLFLGGQTANKSKAVAVEPFILLTVSHLIGYEPEGDYEVTWNEDRRDEPEMNKQLNQLCFRGTDWD